jgi:hypothetical protein
VFFPLVEEEKFLFFTVFVLLDVSVFQSGLQSSKQPELDTERERERERERASYIVISRLL